VVHGTARGAGHPRGAPPQPKVRRVGFALDDPYVEQVWAGVIGPSALLVLRRLPAMWCEREPAVADLRELGQSLGLGPSLARTGRTRRTIERLVSFGMAHWLPGDELGVRTHVTPLNARLLARLAEWTRQVHDRLLGMHLDRLALAHTDRTRGPDRSLDTARLDHLQHCRPAITRGLGLQP
jgi:hypothetical protein